MTTDETHQQPAPDRGPIYQGGRGGRCGSEALGGSPPAGPFPPAGGLPEGLISCSLRDGWQSLRRDPLPLIGFFLLKIALLLVAYWIISGGMLGGLIYGGHHGVGPFRSFLARSIMLLLDGILTASMLWIALRQLRRQDVPFLTIFSGFQRFVPLVVVQVVVYMLVGFGLFLLLIPGIFLALAWGQWPFLIMDRGAGILDALEGSWRMMRGFKGEFLLLWLVLIAINLIGLIPFGLGLIVTVPLSYSVQAAFYERVLRLNPPPAAVAS